MMRAPTDAERELGVAPEILAGWPPRDPPEDFADQVMTRWLEEQTAAAPAALRWSSRWRWTAMVAVALVGVVIVGTLGWLQLTSGTPTSSGTLVASDRQTVALGPRGVAVAEAGSELSWTVDREGGTRVNQSRGKVFYRVAPGGPFVVVTPASEVRLRGTSFHVEVVPMGWATGKMIPAAGGAVLALAVGVTVWEGRVILANEHGTTSVSAGEQAWARPDSPPSEAMDLADGADAESLPTPDQPGKNVAGRGLSPLSTALLQQRYAALQTSYQEQQQELAHWRGRVRELEQSQAAGTPPSPEGALTESFYPPTPTQLAQWAKTCTLHVDGPPIFGVAPGKVGDRAEELGLEEGEREVLNQAMAQLHDRLHQRMGKIYLEATGDEAGAETLSSRAMMGEVTATALPQDLYRTMRRITRERAGLEQPPAELDDLSQVEQAKRLFAGLGDEFQELVAARLGAERARELRANAGGWPWSKSIFSGCGRQ